MNASASDPGRPGLALNLVVDYICPWSYLGLRVVQLALAEARRQGLPGWLSLHAFQLNPQMPEQGMDRRIYRSQKFGSWKSSQEREKLVQERATPYGLSFHFDRIARTPSTRMAHELVLLAAGQGLDVVLGERLFEAYFVHGVDIGHAGELEALAVGVGLERSLVAAALATGQYRQAVFESQLSWPPLGLTGVPFIWVPEKGRAIPGLPRTSQILKLLTGDD